MDGGIVNVSVGFQSNDTRRQRAERYPRLQPCLNESACVLFKAVKQLVAPTGFLRREKGAVQRLRLGTERRGKRRRQLPTREGSFKRSRLAVAAVAVGGVKELVFQQ